MQDELKALNDHVLAVFGQPVTLTLLDLQTLETSGIFTKELVVTGSYDGVMQEVTVLSLDRTFQLQRGVQVESGTDQWTVDRKLKDDGSLAYWNLHEIRS